jgi:rRNA processing protein Krr1/Pno1
VTRWTVCRKQGPSRVVKARDIVYANREGVQPERAFRSSRRPDAGGLDLKQARGSLGSNAEDKGQVIGENRQDAQDHRVLNRTVVSVSCHTVSIIGSMKR